MQRPRTEDRCIYLDVARQATYLELLETLRAVLVAWDVGEHRRKWAIGGISDGDIEHVVGNVTVIYESCGELISASKRNTIILTVGRSGEGKGCGVGTINTMTLAIAVWRSLASFLQHG